MHQPVSPTATALVSPQATPKAAGSFVRPFVGFTLSTTLACILLALTQL
jgi:hypothetical protein